MLWETLKAVLIISYSAHAVKQHRIKIQELADSILDLDCQYSGAPTPELYKKTLVLQTEFNLLSTAKAEQLLLHTRGTFYEHGDKLVLAHHIKCKSASRMISQVMDSPQNLTVDPAIINNTFTSYYSTKILICILQKPLVTYHPRIIFLIT